jgi:hypothetical protein
MQNDCGRNRNCQEFIKLVGDNAEKGHRHYSQIFVATVTLFTHFYHQGMPIFKFAKPRRSLQVAQSYPSIIDIVKSMYSMVKPNSPMLTSIVIITLVLPPHCSVVVMSTRRP